MYRRPELYDAIYSFKEYGQEAEAIDYLIQEHKKSPGNALLDVACGTGKHIWYLRDKYKCTGLDLSAELLRAARDRNPDVAFFPGDMRDFDLGEFYDVVTCLFSAIGYCRTFTELESAFMSFSKHLAPGGIAIVEPWIFPENWLGSRIALNVVDEPEYKASRMIRSGREGNLSVLRMSFMVGTPEGVECWEDTSELGLYTQPEYEAAMKRAGLDPIFVEGGITGRGLFIGSRGA